MIPIPKPMDRVITHGGIAGVVVPFELVLLFHPDMPAHMCEYLWLLPEQGRYRSGYGFSPFWSCDYASVRSVARPPEPAPDFAQKPNSGDAPVSTGAVSGCTGCPTGELERKIVSLGERLAELEDSLDGLRSAGATGKVARVELANRVAALELDAAANADRLADLCEALAAAHSALCPGGDE